MPPPVPIQVVFQGGGAKLASLMAVCEVLQDSQKAGKIEITRTAGSSAGAISAVMLVSSKSVKDYYKPRLKIIGIKYVASMRTNLFVGCGRVLRGKAYFEPFSLEEFFLDLFQEEILNKKLSDLQIEALLFYTDLYTLEARVAEKSDAVSRALFHSCRFPFVFSGYKSDNTAVDGGLAINLPVDEWDESTKGGVIGITFRNEFRSNARGGLLGYAQQLFSAAIQHGVSRSQALLREDNVFTIDTQIGTFDFDLALTVGFGSEYNEIKTQFGTWLDNWLGLRTPSGDDGIPTRYARPPLSTRPLPVAMISMIDDDITSRPPTKAKSVYIYDVAQLDDNGVFTGMYEGHALMTFDVMRPTRILQFAFEIGKSASFSSARFGCAAYDSHGDPLPFVPEVQELTTPASALRYFRVFFMFDEKLDPSGPAQPYAIDCCYLADDPYPNLGKREVSAVVRRQGPTEKLVLAVAFPRTKLNRLPKITDFADIPPEQLVGLYRLEGGEKFVRGEKMSPHDYVPFLGLKHEKKYFLVGRQAVGLEQGEGLGFMIE
ncbi:MAG: patatin-like phospholipase family protein [Rhodoplanes sp.]